MSWNGLGLMQTRTRKLNGFMCYLFFPDQPLSKHAKPRHATIFVGVFTRFRQGSGKASKWIVHFYNPGANIAHTARFRDKTFLCGVFLCFWKFLNFKRLWAQTQPEKDQQRLQNLQNDNFWLYRIFKTNLYISKMKRPEKVLRCYVSVPCLFACTLFKHDLNCLQKWTMQRHVPC